MKDNKYTTLEKIGLILLIAGLSLEIITIMVASFKADILLGTLMLGLFMAIAGAVILRN